MESSTSHPPTRPSLKKLGGLAAGLLHSHLELLGIEYQEEKARIFSLLVSAGLILLFALLLLISLSCLLVLAFWETHRLWVVAGLCTVYCLGLLVAVCKAKRLLSQASPFQDSLNELKKAREQLLP